MITLDPKRKAVRGECCLPVATARLLSLLVAGGIALSGPTPRNDAFAQVPPPMGTPAPTKHMSPVELFSTHAPAVVKLVVQGEGGGVVSSGSGFVLSAPSSTICHVVTNYHVIRAAVGVNVEFHDGSVADVRDVLSEDPALDLAILRVELRKPREPLAHATLDIQNGDQPSIGTRLYAIGSPKGMKNTLSDGLLSGYRSEGSQVTWVQITNPISPGSSGGPVFTDTGAFVGVTTASLPDAQNLNFAISAKKVQEFVAREKAPRPLWKGSCIECEEKDYLFKFYKEVYERFRKKDGDPELRSPSDWSDVGMWTLGIDYSPTQRFLEFCKAEASAGNKDAMILLGCFHAGASGLTNPERITRSNEAATLLKQLLVRPGEDKFFILLQIGKAQVSLFWGVFETAGALEGGARERLLDDAIRTFEAARDMRPGFAPNLFHLAETLVLRGRLGAALQMSGQLALLVPNSPKAHSQRAEILRLLGSKLAAIDELRIACALNPYDDFAAMQLGDLYTETGQHEKAIDAYRSGLEIDESRHASRWRDVELAESEGKAELAAAARAYAQAFGGPNWRLLCSIARAFVALKRYDEAVDAYRRALDAAGDGAGPKNRAMLEDELAACRAALGHPR
jgi:tetratricopeptide (TPR) repeat protein